MDKAAITPDDLRKDILSMMYYSKSSHIGGCLSCVDILYALYFTVMDTDKIKRRADDRDIFILSKGHNSAALYTVLAHAGFFPLEYLNRYYINEGVLPGHLDMTSVPGIECSAGSLGHGAGIGLGMAIGKERSGKTGQVYVLLGDGECNEGSVWEAIMLAATLKQKNYTLIIDFNHLQGMGSDIITQGNLSKRIETFGFQVTEIDGHNQNEIVSAVQNTNGPHAVIAHTIKGKGVSFMENKLEWHYKSPNEEQLALAIREITR